jgi:hypothetical protein
MSLTAAEQIQAALGPTCRNPSRRAMLLAQVALNGIDFVEFEIVGATNVLHAHFLNDLPAGAYGLPADPSPIHLHGGTRIVGVAVTSAGPNGTDPAVLDIVVDQQGDFSPYLLSIGWSRDDAGVWTFAFDPLDRPFSVAGVNFRPGCPIDVDCAPVSTCPPDAVVEPALDYFARDYASFRQMLLDYVAVHNPTWIERSPADLGIALLELFAHEGDHLAYFQDAVANEAFLDTARQRVSAKRHAKLVDYQMHDGRNAWTFVHFAVTAAGTIAPSSTDRPIQLVTRINSPMRFDRDPAITPVPQPTSPPGPLLHSLTGLDVAGAAYDDYLTDPALAAVRAFELASPVIVDPLNNELHLHTWGNDECCLGRGTTSAHVYAISGLTAVRPPLAAGDFLLMEEVLGPATGNPADADRTHRQVVQIVRVDPDPSISTTGPQSDAMRDRLFLADIDPVTHQPTPVTSPVPIDHALPLVEVTWRQVDALTVPICLTTKIDDRVVAPISVARGNIGLADHGRTVSTNLTAADLPRDSEIVGALRIQLPTGPLSMECGELGWSGFAPVRNTRDLTGDVRQASPAIVLWTESGVNEQIWRAVPDLLSSTDVASDFVVDVDDLGRGVLRFGDGEYGQRLVNLDRAVAWYRIGNGVAGNIGADSLAHIVLPDVLPAAWPIVGSDAAITAIRNPLPAVGGVDAETIEQVRQYAPAAFRAMQLRAVTERDYRDAALTLDGVSGAVAAFRWTGSWYTVFVGIDPDDPEDVVTDVRGITRLAPAFKQHVFDGLTRYRLAGYDLEIRSAAYVPIDIVLQICVKAGFFRGDVAQAVSTALSGPPAASGARAFFDPANFTFAQPVYLSRIYAAVEAIDGVESASVTGFHRHGRPPASELADGVIPIGAWEIARLDNDRSNLENGTLTVTAGGGS